MVEAMEMPFGMVVRGSQEGPRYDVFDGGPALPTGVGKFCGKMGRENATRPFPKLLSDLLL